MSSTFATLLAISNEEKVMQILETDFDQSQRNLRGYRRVLDQLVDIKPAESPFGLLTERSTDDGRERIEIYGVLRDEPGRVLCDVTAAPWEQWMGAQINDLPVGVEPEAVVAGCLFEMTWHGFNPVQIQRATQWQQFTRGLSAHSESKQNDSN